MKKVVLSVFAILAMFAVVSCGPSKEEIRAKEVADSTRVADSIALVHTQYIADSTAKAQAEQAKLDSIAKSTKKVTKKAKK
jgi:hypothetical protein